MRRYVIGFTVLILCGLATPEVKAQTVTLAVPTPGAGSITASGTYTIGAGWVVRDIVIQVRPANGAAGTGGQVRATVNENARAFTGIVARLPNGTYDVQAIMQALDQQGNTRYIYSNTRTGVQVTQQP